MAASNLGRGQLQFSAMWPHSMSRHGGHTRQGITIDDPGQQECSPLHLGWMHNSEMALHQIRMASSRVYTSGAHYFYSLLHRGKCFLTPGCLHELKSECSQCGIEHIIAQLQLLQLAYTAQSTSLWELYSPSAHVQYPTWGCVE